MSDRRTWGMRAAWAALALVTAMLWWRHESGNHEAPAVVRASRHQLGPVEAVRVAAVYVRPGEAVKAGDPIADFECQEVEDDLAVARATLEECFAEAEAMSAEIAAEARRQRLQVETDLARSTANLAAAKGQHEGQEAELAMLRGDLARLDEAVRNRVAQADRLMQLRARQKRLASEAQHAPEAVRAWSASVADIRRELDAIADGDAAVRASPLRARIETQARRVDGILARRQGCTLRSPVDGTVSEVFRSTGDTLAGGEGLATVVSASVVEVTAYADSRSADAYVAGAGVEVRPAERVGGSWPGTVERVGPEIVELPARLWPAPDRPTYGRPVHVRLQPGADLFPGEVAFVAAQSGALQAAPLPPGAAQAMALPAALASRTAMEISGAVWVPERGKFIVVSDDTGHGDDEHAPWVFAVDRGGAFDPEPLLLEGVDRVSDLESVTRAPDGTLYFLASQSVSRKGKRPAKRQWLLRVRDDGGRLEVSGRIALYDDFLRGLDPGLRGELGVSDQLDVEGIAWREDGLLVGLKAPLDGAGRSRLWLLPRPDRLFAPDGVAGADEPRLLGSVSLPTCAAAAPGGISDLFLDEGKLYVLSTLPRGPECGSAWVVDLAGGGLAPRKLADWPLKPEGIARAGDGALLVFFDTGATPPLFTHLDEAGGSGDRE